MLLQLHASGARIVEVPIPTYYGDEICHVDGLRYARDVSADVLRYRLGQIGFGSPLPGTEPDGYEWKPDEGSSHARLLSLLQARPPGRVLDLGCSTGVLGQRLARGGAHRDRRRPPPTRRRPRSGWRSSSRPTWTTACPWRQPAHGPYDIVVAADVLEHVRDPGRLLDEALPLLAPGGSLVASVPNIGHWYPRSRVAVGRFDYDQRGILDRDHVRFFTRRSFTRLAQRHGWRVVATEATGLPFDVVDRGVQPGLGGALRGVLGWADRVGVKLWPTLFGYQFIVVLEPTEPTARTGGRSPARSPTRRPG